MGMTYQFTKLNKEDLLSGKIKDMMPKKWADHDPVYNLIEGNTIGCEMDREDFIGNIMWDPEKWDEGIDKRLLDEPAHTVLGWYDLCIVTRQMAQRGFDTLKALDEKVSSMPYKKLDIPPIDQWHRAGIMLKEYATEQEYTEPCDIYENGDYVYYGMDAQDVAIVKEVAKVYRGRQYHYGYPWKPDPGGSGYVKRNFLELLRDMDRDKEGKYAYFYRAY